MRVANSILGTIIALALVTNVAMAVAQDQQRSTIHAVALIVPPVVMRENGQLTGFSIDIWHAIAARLKVKTDETIVPDVQSALTALRSKQADIVLTPSYYSTQRDEEFDYNYPILNAGLLIMVSETSEIAAPSPLLDLLHLILSPVLLIWLGIAALLMLVPAHIMWIADRGTENSISPTRSYIPGIFYAMSWATSSLISQPQHYPRQHLARFIALIWMFIGVVFVAFFTAQLTTNLTLQQIRGLIQGPEDLPGKHIATVANSIAADYLKAVNAKVQAFPDSDGMFAALLAGKVDAVVFPAPVLRYFEIHGGKGKVKTVGDEFMKRDLSYVVQRNSPIRRAIDSAIVSVTEDGTYDRIYNKWFGGP